MVILKHPHNYITLYKTINHFILLYESYHLKKVTITHINSLFITN